MTIAQILEKMIAYSGGNLHDINHLICVWTYAKTIGELEGLEQETQTTLEIAAITHDIACPLCRRKYGNTIGKHQEEEGAPLVRAFLSDTGLPEKQRERVAYLVSHHHTYTGVDGLDYQILLEADYIVNASENHYRRENLEAFLSRVMKTDSGRQILLPKSICERGYQYARRGTPPCNSEHSARIRSSGQRIGAGGAAVCQPPDHCGGYCPAAGRRSGNSGHSPRLLPAKRTGCRSDPPGSCPPQPGGHGS